MVFAVANKSLYDRFVWFFIIILYVVFPSSS